MNLAGSLIPLLTLACGGMIVWAGSSGRPSRLLSVQKAFAIVLIGVMVSGWWALLLAELSRFSLSGWAVGMIIILAAAGVWGWRRRSGPLKIDHRPLVAVVMVGLLLAVVATFIGPPFEYIVGGRDHGVYINTGIHIARSGSILVNQPEFADLSPASRAVLTDPRTDPYQSGLPGPWSQGQRLMGLTIRDDVRGVFAPHAFHLYPAYFALFYEMGGLEWVPYATLILALLSIWAVFMTADLLFGRWIAWGSVVLLATHLTTHWFARYPSAEILVQLLFWGGIWFFLLWLRDRRSFYGLAAGAAFGLLHLAKLDTVFVPPYLLLFFAADRLLLKNRRSWKSFWIPYVILTIQAIWHAWQIATIYTIDHLVRVLLPGFLADPLANAAAGLTDSNQILGALLRQSGGRLLLIAGAGAAVIWLINRPMSLSLLDRLSASRWFRSGAALFTAALFVLFFIIDWLSPSLVKNVPTVMLAYSGGFVMVLALIGVSSRIWRAGSAGEWFFWGMIAIHILPFLVLGLGTALDHFWAIRRLIVVYFPAVFVAAMVGLNVFQLRDRRWRGFQPLWLVAAVVLLAVPQLTQTTRFWRVIEYDGIIERLSAIDENLPDRSILLFTQSPEAIEISLPLWLAFDHPTYVIDPTAIDDPALKEAVDVWLSQERPVYWAAAPQLDRIPPDTIANYEFSAGWVSPLVVSRRNAIPDTVGERFYLFDFYRLSTSAAGAQTVYSIPLFAGDPNQVVSGLHNSEPRPGKLPLRWTTGDLQLKLSAPNRASGLIVMMGNPRPPDAPPPVTEIIVNGHTIATISPPRQPQAFHFDLRDLELVGSAERPVEIAIRTEPWRPAAAADGLDERPLGIFVPWVKYVTKP